jgi:hypothetical protein
MKSYGLFLSLTLGAFASYGGAAIANVSSAQPFTLDGNSVWAAGVNSWPVVLGDEIETADAPAVVSFEDGSRISLSPHSRVKLGGTDAEPKVILVAGLLDYNLAAGSKVSVSREMVAPENGSGSAKTAVPATTVRNKSKKALYGVLGAGGGAAAIGAAMMGGGSKSSGSSSSSGGSTTLDPISPR